MSLPASFGEVVNALSGVAVARPEGYLLFGAFGQAGVSA